MTAAARLALDGQEAERVLERLAELADLARLAREPARPSERGADQQGNATNGSTAPY